MKYNKNLFPFRPNWVTIDNHDIHYIDEGKGQIILFSHAALGSSFMYRRFFTILRRQFRCIALDYPGFGLSVGQPEHFSIVSQSKILEKFIHTLKLKDIIALGHDTGGPSLFKVAADHPELFKGLILTDTVIFPTKEYPKIHNMLKLLSLGVMVSLNAWTNFLVKMTINFGMVTRKLTSAEKAVYYSMFDTSEKRKSITQVLTSLKEYPHFMEKVQLGFKEQLNAKPTLLIYGEKDPVTQLGIPDRIYRMLENAELFFVKKEGHFPHEGQAELMENIISQWIQDQNNKKTDYSTSLASWCFK